MRPTIASLRAELQAAVEARAAAEFDRAELSRLLHREVARRVQAERDRDDAERAGAMLRDWVEEV